MRGSLSQEAAIETHRKSNTVNVGRLWYREMQVIKYERVPRTVCIDAQVTGLEGWMVQRISDWHGRSPSALSVHPCHVTGLRRTWRELQG